MRQLRWALALCLCAPCVRGQDAAATQTTPLRGVVLDPAGTAIPGVDVTLSRDAAELWHGHTDAVGVFTFMGVPREYGIAARALGFVNLQDTVTLFTANTVSRVTLQVGSSFSPLATPEPEPLQTQPSSVPGLLQEGLVQRVAGSAPWEFGVLAQGGTGVADRSKYQFFSLGGHLGKVLTPNFGAGLLQGNFEYAVEVFPLWQSYTPRLQKISCPVGPGAAAGTYTCSQPYGTGGTYTGVSVTPIIVRWNLTHGERWMPWVQGAGGVVWTNHKYPEIGDTDPANLASNGPGGDASVWNFTPQFGVGAHYFVRPKRSLDFAANAVHLSSASLGDKNPGVNASVQIAVGYSWWK